MTLGPNLIRNPDCVLALEEWGQGSLGPNDWISFSGDRNIASQQGVISETGDYKLIVVYESNAAFRARVGNSVFQSIPAGDGAAELDFTVTDASYDGISFSDSLQAATGRILHVELRKVS